MKLDEGDIKDLVAETERKRSDWAKAAEEWEKMWALQRFDDTRTDIKELDGIEAITTPDPFNIVQMVSRIVASDIRVEIPYIDATEEDDDRSIKMEEWITSFWQRSSRQQGRNIIDDMTWQSAVRGRGAMQILWVQDELPKKLQGKRLPILPRTLDPLNVGVKRGPYWTEHAYHKYDASYSDIKQRYPDYELPDLRDRYKATWEKKLKTIDFWYMDEDGNVCHCVTIDDKFAKKPTKTDYPEIPIIEWMADGAPVEEEMARSLSILHPIRASWKYKCELVSKIGTGLLYYFDPLMIAKGFGPGQKIQAGPGEIAYLEADQSVDAYRPEPNVPMAEKMLAIIQQGMDQAAFPPVAFGDAPGGVTAGFALNNLTQQAKNRVGTIRGNLEGALEQANELIFMLVENFADAKGVEMWGKSSMNDSRSRPIVLKGKDIGGIYANEVRLIPEAPGDESARIGIYLQMVDKGIISKATMRNRGVNIPLPRDEETRVAIEAALQMPEMAQKATLRAIQKMFRKQDDWEINIIGTPLQQMYDMEKQWLEQQAQQEEAAKEAKRQAKIQQEQQLLMEEMAKLGIMPPQGMQPPPGMMPPPMNASSPGGMPPMPPGMPPGMQGPSSGMGPGMMPGMPPGGMPPGSMPTGQQGVPPEAMGMMTPEAMGIPPGGLPGDFQAMQGQPLPDDEMLRQLMMQGGAPMPPQM